MMMNLKAVAISGMLSLAAVGPTPGWAEASAPPDQRERDLHEARQRRAREIARAERERTQPDRDDDEEDVRRREGFAEELRARRELDDELDRLHAELQELRAREIDLREAQQTAAIEGRQADLEELLVELVRVRHEMERHELEGEHLEMEKQRRIERRELMRMTERLEYVSSWRDVAFEPEEAVMMATQSFVELHMTGGDAPQAADALEQLLGRVDELGTRTAIRFALKDVYVETGRLDLAAEQMTQVVLENARAIAASSIFYPAPEAAPDESNNQP